MTLIAAMDLGTYALVAADSRETFFRAGLDETQISEECEKVRATPLGLATGSGLTRPLFGAIEHLARHLGVLRDHNRTAAYLRQVMGDLAHSVAEEELHPAVRAHLERAGWVFTSRERGRIVVRRHHTERRDYAPEYFPNGLPVTLLPIDVAADRSMPHELALKAAAVRCGHLRDIDATLATNLRAFAEFFAAIDNLSEHLGVGIQFGLHFVDGTVDVLPIEPLESFLR